MFLSIQSISLYSSLGVRCVCLAQNALFFSLFPTNGMFRHTVLEGRVRFFFVSEAKISIFDQHIYTWIRSRVIWNILSASNGNFLIEADKIFSFIPNLIQETICGRKVPILAPDTKFKPMFGSEAVWSMPPPPVRNGLGWWSTPKTK